ncbi:SEC-C domain-containing protein [Bacillus tianshenii]|nr:SEC-C domain-containing protein [Bacillus tianshenii]
MAKVKRNDPCPCGSGKKYKQCCLKQKTVSITDLIHKELVDAYRDIINYGLTKYETFLWREVRQMIKGIESKGEEEEFYAFELNLYIMAMKAVDGQHTIIEDYIKKNASKYKRTRVREIIESWGNSEPFIGEVIETSEAEKAYVLKDYLTGEERKIYELDSQEDLPELQSVSIGILLPLEDSWTFFATSVDILSKYAPRIKNYLHTSYSNSGIDSVREWMNSSYAEILRAVMFGEFEVEPAEMMEWNNEKHKAVAELITEQFAKEKLESSFIQFALILWSEYCQQRNPRIRNERLYAASMHYLVMDILRPEQYTQSELGKLYGVPANSISTKYNDMGDELEDKIVDMLSIEQEEEPEQSSSRMGLERQLFMMERSMADKNFESVEEINEFMRDEPGESWYPASKRDQAQMLLYDAYDANPPERYELAKKALSLHLDSPDAYNIMAELTESPEDELAFYARGVDAGEKDLGEAFFKEHKGDFYMQVSTRPYMRVKMNYAQQLYLLDDVEEALHQYEEMLMLNPNDNQGVRYLLLTAYLEEELFEEAERLLEAYDNDGMASFQYNRAYLHYQQHGITTELVHLLKEAKKQNPHVLDFLLGKREITSRYHSQLTVGGVTEAEVYAQDHAHLWVGEESLMNWLAKQWG